MAPRNGLNRTGAGRQGFARGPVSSRVGRRPVGELMPAAARRAVAATPLSIAISRDATTAARQRHAGGGVRLQREPADGLPPTTPCKTAARAVALSADLYRSARISP